MSHSYEVIEQNIPVLNKFLETHREYFATVISERGVVIADTNVPPMILSTNETDLPYAIYPVTNMVSYGIYEPSQAVFLPAVSVADEVDAYMVTTESTPLHLRHVAATLHNLAMIVRENWLDIHAFERERNDILFWSLLRMGLSGEIPFK